jgi:hypothetical protein
MTSLIGLAAFSVTGLVAWPLFTILAVTMTGVMG